MTHAEMDELYDLYALGALETDLASQIDEHVADDCGYCIDHIHKAVNATAMLSGLVDPAEPPAEVRRRLMASVRPAPKQSRRWNFLVDALAVACLVLLAIGVWSNVELTRRQHILQHVLAERNQLRTALEIMARAQTRTVQFGQSNNVAHGRVFVSPNGTFVMIGSDLPAIASDRTFELWLIPAKGAAIGAAPVPAGLFRPNESGTAVHVYQEPVNIQQIAAVAVTVEPSQGSLAPTTQPFLVVPIA